MTTQAPPDLDPRVLRRNAYSTDQNLPTRLWRCTGKHTEDKVTRYGFEDVRYPDHVRYERVSSQFIARLDYLTQGRNLP